MESLAMTLIMVMIWAYEPFYLLFNGLASPLQPNLSIYVNIN